MKIGFPLRSRVTGEYKTKDGTWSKDLNQAILFSGKQAAKRSDTFGPNFDFPTVKEENGVRTLES